MEKAFTKEILKKVKQLEITTKHMVNDALSGQYHSVFKGQGMDFSEIREYVYGDEVKNIDWKVTVRHGSPHIKVFTEERERTILLTVDVSSSTLFGSHRNKRELMAELSGVIAFSAAKNSDKVGLLLFSDKIELYIPPGKGRSHQLRIIRELLFFKPTGKGSNFLTTLDFINKKFSKKIVAFLITDFNIPVLDDEFKKRIKILGKHHDLISIRIRDINEIDIPNVGIITVEDLETGELLEVDTGSKKTRELYNSLTQERDDAIKKTITSYGLDFIDINTNDDYMPALIKFFTLRKRRH